jgi:hypothetical protein
MYDTIFQHRRTKANVGDLACSPGHYFDFGRSDFLDLSEDAPTCRRAIMGGGQIFDECVAAAIYRTARARHKVVWGVGISPKNVNHFSFDILEGSCALIASRNWDVPRCDYVPCATAMSPLFDAPPAPTRDAVLFSHASQSAGLARLAGMPEMTNGGSDMAEAIAFIASGETVVTNSFHGTFWALCLGRKVLCVPFSPKFRQFRENPVFAGPQDWPGQLKKAEAREGVLDDARVRNRAFYDKVMSL